MFGTGPIVEHGPNNYRGINTGNWVQEIEGMGIITIDKEYIGQPFFT